VAGGVKGIYNTSVSTVGNNSVFHTITSNGGGAGGNYNATATVNGGSGGGAAYSGTPGNGTLAQGYGGGSNMQSAYGYGNGGGGGAAAIGGNATTTNSGSGGIGTINSILNSTNASASYIGQVSGSNVYYAGGGGGGVLSGYGTGPGGLGGGGAGGIGVANDGEAALNNTGGGGGGAGKTAASLSPSADGGDGGSGVVILRYPTASVSSFTTTGTLNTPSTTDTLANNNYPVTNTAYYTLDGNANGYLTTTDLSTVNYPAGAGCVALYELNGNANDTSNTYNGLANNITYYTGAFDQAAVFNGSSSYIDLGTSLLGNRSAFSVSTWANFDNLNTQNFIFYNSESGTGGNLGFYDYGNGSIYFQPDASTSANRGYISNSGIYTTDEWVHIVMNQHQRDN
jgi:hypothetical protein